MRSINRKLQCLNCEYVFNEDDADVVSECIGEFWGAPAFEQYNACPKCGSTDVDDYEEEENEDDD